MNTEKITKKEVIDMTAAKAGVPIKDVTKVYNALSEVILEAISSGEEIVGLNGVKFSRRWKNARKIVSNFDGKQYDVPGRYEPQATFFKSMRMGVNDGE